MSAVPALELIAQDAAAVQVAVEIGAARIELCQALALGGLTPSIATIEHAVAAAAGAVEVHALIRVRPGGFRYDDDELWVMADDVRAAVAAGASGVVVGCLDHDGRFDREQMRRLRDAAGEAGFAAHRAIDVSADPLAAIDDLIALDVDRVLTSGAASTALEGAGTLAAMVARADGRIDVMAGGGVTADSVEGILRAGVPAIHFSAKRTVRDGSGVSMGSAETDGVGSYDTVDADLARGISAAVRAFGGDSVR
ncbi:copper homeostasis protein CutC [Microbacterium sp. NPDC058389]|uniref:copper homeostasis protein CutC n=1 Tax=Microbacterium sp. NPDC058389 TaxID=3346475 RepID=UPI00364C166A